ncbi:hypothetical protein AAG906_023621 [Vitis piasezkii]
MWLAYGIQARSILKTDKIHGFLGDLQDKFESVQSQTFHTIPLPSLNSAYCHRMLQMTLPRAWRQIGKNPLPRKDDYLTGAVTAPPPEDPKFKTWKSENSMVMSWLINFMTNEIGEDFMFYETAKEIWDATKETNSDKENTSELFEHFNALNRCWQHLDLFDENKLGCPECCQKY